MSPARLARTSVVGVTIVTLLPATASVVALAVSLGASRRLHGELVAVRRSLRRAIATSVAADELVRVTTTVGEQARVTATGITRLSQTRPRWPRAPSVD